MKKFVKISSVMLSAIICVFTAAAFMPETLPRFSKVGALLLKIQPSFSWWFLAILALTFIWGRFFCERMCPLGILQSLINWVFHPKNYVRRICTRLPESKLQRSVRCSALAITVVLCALGYWGVAYFVTPYSIIGKAITAFIPGVVVLALVLATASLGEGRFWCNWICPVGTIFTILSRFSVRKSKVGSGCSNCRRCFGCKNEKPQEESLSAYGITRREVVHGAALFAVTGGINKTVDGGFAPVSYPGVPTRSMALLPPGAISYSEFAHKCVGCGLCVKHCPSKIIRLSADLKTFGQPEMYFKNGYCRISCNYKCAAVCPTGALTPRTSDRTKLHIGTAHWNMELCVRTKNGDQCKACERNCPVDAIKVINNAVVIDACSCIGCGACEHVCPSRPMPAIWVEPLERQKEVLPMGEQDLVEEMISLVESGDSCVLASNGVIVARSQGQGISPLLGYLESGTLKGAVLADKVIGLAAAAICVQGGVRQVNALVMSTEASQLLKSHGISNRSRREVGEIKNRAKNGLCPMEKVAKDVLGAGGTIENCVKSLKQAVAKIK